MAQAVARQVASSFGLPAPVAGRGPGATRIARAAHLVALLATALLFTACGGGEAPAVAGHNAWSVTAWGDGYEIFPEAPALVEGEPAVAHTHVTVLGGFRPLAEGPVELVLRRVGAAEGRAFVFAAPEADRPGIFPVEVTPPPGWRLDLRLPRRW